MGVPAANRAPAPVAIRPLALLAVVVAVSTWGMSSIAIKVVSMTGLVASLYRLWFAIPLLWIGVLALPSVRRGLTTGWLRASLLGGTLFGVHQLFFFNTVKLTSIVNVTVIGALQPLLVLAVAGRMFGEQPTRAGVLWSAVALGGTALVVGSSAGAPSWSALGDTLAVLNLFAFTAYFLASKRVRSRVGAAEYVIGMTTVAGVVVFAAAWLSGQDLSPPSGADAAILLGIAIVPGTLGHVLTNWAHVYVPAFVMSMMLLAVPVIASVAAAVFLGEALTPGHAVGGTLVLLAIARVLRSTRARTSGELAAGAARTDAP